MKWFTEPYDFDAVKEAARLGGPVFAKKLRAAKRSIRKISARFREYTPLGWCVRHREGWCLMKRQPKNEPQEPKNGNEATVCQHFVILPGGYKRQRPTCSDCQQRWLARETRKVLRQRASTRG